MKHSRILLLALLLAACNKGSPNQESKSADENANRSTLKTQVEYTCPMHPQIRSPQAGVCPICGMELVKIEGSDAKKGADKTIHLKDVQLLTANIKTDTIRAGSLRGSVSLSGRVTYNEQADETISAWATGRLERLYIRNPGDRISVGQKLFDVYSEELLKTQQEYLISTRQRDALSKLSVDIGNALAAQERKMERWGMSKKQIADLAKSGKVAPTVAVYSKKSGILREILKNEGEQLNEGEGVFKINAKPGELWVLAEMPGNELGLLNKQTKISVSSESLPGRIFEGTQVFNNKVMQGSSGLHVLTLKIHQAEALKPGMQANVTLSIGGSGGLTVPKSAIIYGAEKQYTWMRLPDGSFERREVQLGKENEREVEVIQGLHGGEILVVSGTYLLNSEYVLKFGQGSH